MSDPISLTSGDLSSSVSAEPIEVYNNGHGNGNDDLDSLPSVDTHDSLDYDDDTDEHGESDAEREWRESLQQLELLLTVCLVPYMGKYFGRKAAYWGMLFQLYSCSRR